MIIAPPPPNTYHLGDTSTDLIGVQAEGHVRSEASHFSRTMVVLQFDHGAEMGLCGEALGINKRKIIDRNPEPFPEIA